MYFLDGLCANDALLSLIKFIKVIVNLIKIAVPIGLIVYGSLDLGKAVIAGKEDEIKANQQVLLKRLLAAVLVFFVTTFVELAMGLIGGEENEWKECWKAANKTNYIVVNNNFE